MGSNGLRPWSAARRLLGRDGCAAKDEDGQGLGEGDGGNVCAHRTPLRCPPPRPLPERLPTFPALRAERHGRTCRGARSCLRQRLPYRPRK